MKADQLLKNCHQGKLFCDLQDIPDLDILDFSCDLKCKAENVLLEFVNIRHTYQPRLIIYQEEDLWWVELIYLDQKYQLDENICFKCDFNYDIVKRLIVELLSEAVPIQTVLF